MTPEQLTNVILEFVNLNRNYEDIDYNTLRNDILELLQEEDKK